MNKTTKSLIDYLKKHPELRTWQAIRNWSKADFIYWDRFNKKIGEIENLDTYYWRNKNI